MARLRSITVVDDRTARSRCEEGFLRLRRLRLRNEYEDGSASDEYDCDMVSRRGVDAVVAVLYERDDSEQEGRSVRVLLREGIRAPVYLRRHKTFVQPDPREYREVGELVAGLIEEQDGPGLAGLSLRASAEAHEEAGLDVDPSAFSLTGGETFASPGITDEKLFFCAAPARLADADVEAAPGDGSVMEEGARLRVLTLREAIRACRSGQVPDMKTEVGLLRLCDHLGYLPQLDLFVDELPAALQRRRDDLGVERVETTG